MTDRFKFRVWIGNKYEEEAVEDCYITYNGELVCGCWFDDVFCGHSAYYEDNEVIVEQCTGLKDKNGKLIYENDIVFINGEKWHVIWNDEDCAFFFSNLKDVYHQPIFPDFYMGAGDFKVIGNIHTGNFSLEFS